jgi:hypothetical protein
MAGPAGQPHAVQVRSPSCQCQLLLLAAACCATRMYALFAHADAPSSFLDTSHCHSKPDCAEAAKSLGPLSHRVAMQGGSQTKTKTKSVCALNLGDHSNTVAATAPASTNLCAPAVT